MPILIENVVLKYRWRSMQFRSLAEQRVLVDYVRTQIKKIADVEPSDVAATCEIIALRLEADADLLEIVLERRDSEEHTLWSEVYQDELYSRGAEAMSKHDSAHRRQLFTVATGTMRTMEREEARAQIRDITNRMVRDHDRSLEHARWNDSAETIAARGAQ